MRRRIQIAVAFGMFLLPSLAVSQQATPALSERSANPHGPNLKEACSSCHAPNGWTPVRIAKSFKHAEKAFPLTGAHATAACASCHKTLDFQKTTTTCASCHRDTHKGELGLDCAKCHTSRAFVDRSAMTRMHQLTRFPLRAAHAVVACESCHLPTRAGQLQFVRGTTTCATCHTGTFRSAAAPPHIEPSFSMDCTACHKTANWKGAQFDHSLTLFPLSGAHKSAICADCHADKQYHGRSMECSSCHQKDYARSTNPPHAQGFPTGCANCHTTTAWTGAQFDHAQNTAFALTGAHRALSCAGCHGDKVFRGKSQECAACHKAAYDKTVTPKHGAAGFSTVCTTCHTTTQWKGAKFDHNTATKFVLSGAHRTATCAACHSDDVYRGKPSTCVSCHQAAFTSTQAPPHAAANFATTCQTCHTTSGWKGAKFDHSVTTFPLTLGHSTAVCADCHADKVYVGKSTECASCHQATYAATMNPPHASAGFPTTCKTCHTTAKWIGAVFDHNTTKFALTGAHRAATCLNCHADKVFAGKPTMCISCHQSDFTGTVNPNHKASGFTGTCETCHTTTQWRGAVFNHDVTKFPLTGTHRTATCIACHADNVFAGKPTTCASCHQTDFNGTTNPNHKASGFPTTCEVCHQTTKWLGAPFNHDNTLFPITGAHKTVTCADCHSNGVYKGKPVACVSCHLTTYNATTSPNHKSTGFSTTCETCHTTTRWPGAIFDHGKTLFPLVGAHKAALCADCHANGVYKGKPTACVSCHQADYNGTVNPNHKALGFPVACEACHTSIQWKGAVFDHNATQFPLTGAHKATTCNDCHASGVYKGLPTACASCHQPDYTASTTPPHVALAFSTLCQSCHTTAQWMGGTYNHSATKFPLIGAHLTATCNDCHADHVYRGKPMTCITCHLSDYNGTTNPNHKTLGFPATCETCHTSIQWKGAVFDHNTTQFPLVGAHKAATCMDCHASGVYKGLPTACASCHQNDYNATTTPPHAASGINTLCQTCHTTVQWQGGTYNHSVTTFPLTGAHLAATCNDCHADHVYRGKPMTCISCHNAEWSATTNPHHAAAGFVTDCQTCHTTVQWKGGTYNHNLTQFPLTGAHVAKACILCHASKVYKGLPATCVSCHLTDYTATTNPNHAAAMFPTTCQSCHTTTQWLGATFNHDGAYFPIYSGKHLQKWTRCSDCHVNSSNYKVFECILCHEHSNKSKVDNDHQGKPGYAYQSIKCYACHPRGTAN